MKITLGKKTNFFCVHSTLKNNVTCNQEIRINANFENVPIFVKALCHEYLHAIINSEIDTSGLQSFMLDNIDTAQNNWAISN